MYGDTRAIRRLATQLRRQADDIRTEAEGLLVRADAVAWRGWTADAMRDHARGRVAGLRRSAQAHDEAAAALDRHASEVDRLQAVIAAIERRFHRLAAAARERLAGVGQSVLDGSLLAGLARALPDPVDELFDRFVPPPPGHRDWLTVDLPGLHG